MTKRYIYYRSYILSLPKTCFMARSICLILHHCGAIILIKKVWHLIVTRFRSVCVCLVGGEINLKNACLTSEVALILWLPKTSIVRGSRHVNLRLGRRSKLIWAMHVSVLTLIFKKGTPCFKIFELHDFGKNRLCCFFVPNWFRWHRVKHQFSDFPFLPGLAQCR